MPLLLLVNRFLCIFRPRRLLKWLKKERHPQFIPLAANSGPRPGSSEDHNDGHAALEPYQMAQAISMHLLLTKM